LHMLRTPPGPGGVRSMCNWLSRLGCKAKAG